MESLEPRRMLTDAAIGVFQRLDGGTAAISAAGANAGEGWVWGAGVDDGDVLAHAPASAIANSETGFAFAYTDATADINTPTNSSVAVPKVGAAGNSNLKTRDIAWAVGDFGGVAGANFQYIPDPNWTGGLFFHGHIFVAGYGGAIASENASATAVVIAWARIGGTQVAVLAPFGGNVGPTITVTGLPGTGGYSEPGGSKHLSFVIDISEIGNTQFNFQASVAVENLSAASQAEGEQASVLAQGVAWAWGYFSPTAAGPGPGDFNGDGNVDGADFELWQSGSPMADANLDGVVDDADLMIWAQNTTELVVSTEADGIDGDYSWGNLSLREAIALAADSNHPGHDTIYFAPSVEEIVLTQGPLTFGGVVNPVAIQGLGADRLTINANGSGSIFSLAQPQNYLVTIRGVTMTGASGYAVVSNRGPNLALDTVEVTGNGGGVYFGNYLGSSILTISNSTIAENNGPGVNLDFATGHIFNTTISGNQTTNTTAAGITTVFGGVTLTNVTITNNRSDKNKTSGTSTGIGGVFAGAPSTVTMHNTIVVGNFAGAVGNSVAADLGRGVSGYYSGIFHSSSSHNLIGTSPSGAFPSGNGNQLGVSVAAVGLLPLAYNGGPTQFPLIVWREMQETTQKRRLLG